MSVGSFRITFYDAEDSLPVAILTARAFPTKAPLLPHVGDNSVSRVVEDALLVRLVLLEGLGSAGQEVGEPIINWEPGEEQTKPEINDLLFRRRPL